MDEKRGTETPEPEILVVDDEAAVRQVLGVALRSAGFSVVLTSDGNEAVHLYQQHSGSIALVLLDVRMPAMDGPQTLAALRQLDPEVCCCFMSGEAGRYSEGELRERGAIGFFEKPFHLEEVIGVVRQIVGGPHRACPSRTPTPSDGERVA